MSKVKFDVVGMNHRLTLPAQRNLERMLEEHLLKVELRREKNNPADQNAIKVVVKDKRPRKRWPTVFGSDEIHLGYLRREVAKVLAPGFDKGTLEVTKAHLVQVNADHGWGRVRVILKSPASKPKVHP